VTDRTSPVLISNPDQVWLGQQSQKKKKKKKGKNKKKKKKR
jgi:hypothetical protein